MGSEEESADAVTEESAAGDDQTKSASPESEGEAAADYLEGLLDIIDADGDIDIDMEGERIRVSVIEVNEGDLAPLVGERGAAESRRGCRRRGAADRGAGIHGPHECF